MEPDWGTLVIGSVGLMLSTTIFLIFCSIIGRLIGFSVQRYHIGFDLPLKKTCKIGGKDFIFHPTFLMGMGSLKFKDFNQSKQKALQLSLLSIVSFIIVALCAFALAGQKMIGAYVAFFEYIVALAQNPLDRSVVEIAIEGFKQESSVKVKIGQAIAVAVAFNSLPIPVLSPVGRMVDSILNLVAPRMFQFTKSNWFLGLVLVVCLSLYVLIFGQVLSVVFDI